jgi:integrase
MAVTSNAGRKAAKRLTDRGVAKLKSKGKEGYYADKDAVGLYVQVAYRQKGTDEDGKPKRDKKHGRSLSWVYRYTSPITRKIRWMGLGSCDVIPLAEARQLAKAARRLVTLGADPIDYRDATAAAEREAYLRDQASKMTFAACADAYLAGRLKGFRNDKSRWQWRKSLDLASEHFGYLNVAEITTPMVIKFLEPIWRSTSHTANRVRGRIEKVLDWAKVRGFRQGENPAAWKGHLQHTFEKQAGSNFAAMPFDQLPAFMARLRERMSASARALEFAILTAARSGEVRGATWGEVDLDKALWTIPADRMKMSKEHTVPLSKQAVALLKALPRIGDYVFPGAIEGKPLSDMALLQQLRGLDANGFSVHGFRSSFRDWAGELTAFDRETIEHALAHQLPSKVEASYRRGTALAKRRKVMELWANYLDHAEIADNVVQLGKN